MSSSPDDTDLLIEEMRSGNREEGARKLFERYHHNVETFFVVKKRVPREEARELTQDVFFRVFRSIDSFRGASEFKAWLFKISQNVFSNWLRGKKSEKRNAAEQSLDQALGDDGTHLDPPSMADTNPLETLITEERHEELQRALDDLPEKMRRCCWMRYVNGLKYQEIADDLGISIETVKAHLFQGRKRLLAALQRGQGPKR